MPEECCVIKKNWYISILLFSWSIPSNCFNLTMIFIERIQKVIRSKVQTIKIWVSEVPIWF